MSICVSMLVLRSVYVRTQLANFDKLVFFNMRDHVSMYTHPEHRCMPTSLSKFTSDHQLLNSLCMHAHTYTYTHSTVPNVLMKVFTLSKRISPCHAQPTAPLMSEFLLDGQQTTNDKTSRSANTS